MPLKSLAWFTVTLLLSTIAHATPTISGVSGTISDGSEVVIAGAGFGSKSPAAPLLWAPFDSNSSPSNLGRTASWALIENMAWDADEGYGGAGGMKGTAGNGAWTMGMSVSSPFNANNAITYVFSREKMNFIVCACGTIANQINFKTRRFWPGSYGKPNVYASSSHSRILVEGPDKGYWANANTNSTEWVAKEWLMKASSASGVYDGTVTERFNGVQKHSGNITSKSDSFPNSWTLGFPVHGVSANKSSWNTDQVWSASNNLWADDVYMDQTYSRVMVGDASTFANCRKFGLVIPSAWADGSITGIFKAHVGDFPGASTAYVYVFDASNVSNTAGKAVTIGGSAPGDPAPTITSVSPSTGAYAGGTASTATGTGFTATPTVMIGTMSATGVGLTGSTGVYFIIPSMIPGTSGLDLKITNPDTQYAVLVATMGYTSAVSNQAPYNVSAGDDLAITLPATATFSGLAFDDGLPGAMTYLWEQQTGPGTITFAANTALETSATFSEAGTYTATLTASDGELSTESAAVTITVNAAVGASVFPWKQE